MSFLSDKVINQFVESDGVDRSIRRLAEIIVDLERAQLDAVQDLHAAHGIDGAIQIQKNA